jgi:hypothetical protein
VVGEANRISHEKGFCHWDLEFPEAFVDLIRGTWKPVGEQGFDAVIGNPPYVSSYSHFSQRSESGDEEYFLERFADALSGRVNTYLVFVASTLRLLREDGRWAMIVPDTILHNESYETTRRHLVRTMHVLQAIKCEYPVFEDSTVGSAILLVQRSHAAPTRVLAARHEDEFVSRCFSFDATVEPEDILGSPAVRFPYVVRGDLSFLKQMRGCPVHLDDICNLHDGVNPGSKSTRALLLDPSGSPKTTWRRLLEGKNIHRYHINPPTRFIDYDRALMTAEVRRQGASLGQTWVFEPGKIVSRQTASELIAAFDDSDAVGTNSVHFTRMKESTHYSEWFVLACLNSSVLNRYYRLEYQETRSTFPQVHISSLRQLPIPSVPRVVLNSKARDVLDRTVLQPLNNGQGVNPVALLGETASLARDQQQLLLHDVVAILAQRRSQVCDSPCLDSTIDVLVAALYEVDADEYSI